MEKPNLAGKEEKAREAARHQGAQGDFGHPWATTKKAQSGGLSGDSSSEKTSGAATLWAPACHAYAVRGKCTHEKWN